MNLEFHDLIGTIGVSLILLMYFLLQIEKIGSDQLQYSVVNLIGAALILYSLQNEFNFSAVLIEAFWVIISLIGIIRYLNRKRKIQ